MNESMVIHQADSVGVALEDLRRGEEVSCCQRGIVLSEDIPAGHKFALKRIEAGASVIKYGNPIGTAIRPISPGEWVHTHNLQTALKEKEEYIYRPQKGKESLGRQAEGGKFLGFERKNRNPGVRNEIWVLPTAGCVNGVAEKIAECGKQILKGSVEDVISFGHSFGCSQTGEDQENTCRILAGLMANPNAGGVLVVGLGCENCSVDRIKKYVSGMDERRIRFLVCQEYEDEIEQGTALVRELIEEAGLDERVPFPVSELVIGLKCGGSDGFSGISANPLVGRFADRVVDEGGSVILTEVPEMFGAEKLLMNRCKDEVVFKEAVSLIDQFKDYFVRHGENVYDNPSPGNKKGGITTLEEKSLGCTQKSGDSRITGVIGYGEKCGSRGLNLLCAPGNDLAASTALAAAGAQLILFTTGRGTPFGAPVPTIKIASNSVLAGKKSGWIDFNAGEALQGRPIRELLPEFYRMVLETASGKKVKSEEAGYRDMAIWKQGVTL